jgi:AraC-like DNA-binding protein
MLPAGAVTPDAGKAAAFKVGYESATQFSREYARMAGMAPDRDGGKDCGAGSWE